jgi:phospholipase C
VSSPHLAWASIAALASLATGCRSSPCTSVNDGVVPATPVDPPLACPVVMPADTHAAERAACSFTTGASVADTLDVTAALSQSIPIRHVIVVMKENRSYDHLLGALHDEGRLDAEAVPASFSNLDLHGRVVRPYRAETTCLDFDPGHQWDAMHDGVDGGAMDGFVKSAARTTGTDGHLVMSYYTSADLPFYHWLARTFALNDRHFASVRSGTAANRTFLLLATNAGVQNTGTFPDVMSPSLLEGLTAAGYTWGFYSDSPVFSSAWPLTHDDPGAYCYDDLLARLDTGTLPSVAFVDGREAVEDDHPDADLQRGERWLRNIYEHALASPQWPRLAMIWVYDEAGGFADHVPPPGPACVARPLPEDQPYTELGTRVPLVIISPYSRPGLVSHVAQEHTSVTRFIEAIFHLPALTARDANSSALLDLFDFSCSPPLLEPPPAPEAGADGCLRPGLPRFDIGAGM